jgi:S1-C subfamily serine protease
MSSRSLARALCSFAVVLTCLAPALPVRAEGTALDAAVLKKVKAATVHLEVTLPSGNLVEGSGFFTDESGVLLTNAHVLGMLDADSRPPTKVDVTVNSGEADSRTLPGKLLGVDRGSDLAVLRVEAKDLPAPLQVVPAKDVNETEEVFVFGFPLGKRLGKNITVSKSSVSSLRKENGLLKQVQVNGGMHPGNSGGPVVNGKGQVIGVAVAIIRGTQINFAIPGEMVQGFLAGKITALAADLGHKDGDKIKMPFRLVMVDPLGRIRKVVVETWTGEPGQRRRPGGTTPPKPLPGDSERQVIPVNYDKQPITSIELSLPPQEDAKRVYWMQASYVNGTGETVWHMAWAPPLGAPVERKEITLRYQPKLDNTQQTELVSDGSFRILLEGEERSLTMSAKSTVSEHTAAQKAGDVLPVKLEYRGFNMNLLEDKKPIKDEELKRDVQNLRFVSADVEMEADGNVGKAKANLAKVPRVSREFLEAVSDQMLQSVELVAVPLPEGTVKPLQTWKVRRTVALGTAVLSVSAQADIKYTYLGTRMLGNRAVAFLDVKGTVKGLRGAGLNVGGTVSGGSQVALDTGEVLSSSMEFKADMDVDTRAGKAKLFGNLTVRVRRDVPPPAKPPEKPKDN